MAASAAARDALCRLRRQIARMEGRPEDSARLADGATAAERRSPRFAFGVPRLDAALGGGLAAGGLHEIRTAESRDGGMACGFLLACLAAFAAGAGRAPAILWIAEAGSRREAGELYGPGLEALGLDPQCLVRVAARRPADALWAFEAGLSCGGVAFAICELRRPTAGLDLTATRRAALRARTSGATGFVLRIGAAAEPSAAETRIRVAPAPSRALGAWSGGLGRPAWRLELEKNRGGPADAFIVEWSPHERRFIEHGERGAEDGRHGASPHPLPVAADPADGPADAGDGGIFIPAGWKRAS